MFDMFDLAKGNKDLAKGNKPNKKLKITKDGTLALSAAETIYTKEGFQQALLELLYNRNSFRSSFEARLL
jgi:hypothetical protein